jgi:hypothetical protein
MLLAHPVCYLRPSARKTTVDAVNTKKSSGLLSCRHGQKLEGFVCGPIRPLGDGVKGTARWREHSAAFDRAKRPEVQLSPHGKWRKTSQDVETYPGGQVGSGEEVDSGRRASCCGPSGERIWFSGGVRSHNCFSHCSAQLGGLELKVGESLRDV